MKTIFNRPLITYVSLLFSIVEIYVVVHFSWIYLLILAIPMALHIACFIESIFFNKPLITKNGKYYFYATKWQDIYQLLFVKSTDIRLLFFILGNSKIHLSLYNKYYYEHLQINSLSYEDIYKGLKEFERVANLEYENKDIIEASNKYSGIDEFTNFDGNLK